jgi:hypothetical protein
MILRDPNGVMKAKLDNRLAQKVLAGSSGKWRPRRGKDGVDQVFEFTKDQVCGFESITVYLWAGDILCNEE